MFKQVLLAIALAGVGCAHGRSETIYQVGRDRTVAVGELHGDQLWFYDGSIGYVTANHHVRMPTFQDAELDGNKLHVLSAKSEIGGNYMPRAASFSR
jgi:hypothetical protein